MIKRRIPRKSNDVFILNKWHTIEIPFYDNGLDMPIKQKSISVHWFEIKYSRNTLEIAFYVNKVKELDLFETREGYSKVNSVRRYIVKRTIDSTVFTLLNLNFRKRCHYQNRRNLIFVRNQIVWKRSAKSKFSPATKSQHEFISEVVTTPGHYRYMPDSQISKEMKQR